MPDDKQALIELNEQINDAENNGKREWLATILAPRLALQRADKPRTIDDQVAFLQKVQKVEHEDKRVLRKIEPIELYGDRAIVKCIIAVGAKEFHNIRLFVRREGDWKLLAWANEQCAVVNVSKPVR
jgi:hypothetical protein